LKIKTERTARRVFADVDAVQNQELAKLKIEPAMISFMADQTDGLITKESYKSLFVF